VIAVGSAAASSRILRYLTSIGIGIGIGIVVYYYYYYYYFVLATNYENRNVLQYVRNATTRTASSISTRTCIAALYEESL